MIGYFIYFQVFQSESIMNSAYNSRLDLYAERVVRGDITSSDGQVLATTAVSEDGSETREYPFGRMFAHVVGYSNNGKGGIESSYNFQMLRSHSFFLTQLINDLKDEKSNGDTVVTTLDYDVQEAAYDALGSNDGAVIVLEVETGKVLAMVSKPDFDPNTLADNWDSIVEDTSSSVLLNRAISGQYPPGSTFKIFTTLEYIHENADYDNYSYECTGVLGIDDNEIHCYHNSVHGVQNLKESFANSCNTSYANIGLGLNINQFQNLCESMLFNQTLPGNIGGKTSSFSLSSADDTGKIMQTAIGQGDTLVSPMHMAIVAAAIANDGVAMEPYLVDHVENDNGVHVKDYKATEYGSLLSASDAAIMQDFMSGVVENGTGSALSGQSYQAAGKTGSAEYNSAGDSHGWFVGYGSKEGYSDIAIAVIVEDGGSGSQSAVPVAKRVFDVYFNQ
jgi:peptidoglycan glycosyltransferase